MYDNRPPAEVDLPSAAFDVPDGDVWPVARRAHRIKSGGRSARPCAPAIGDATSGNLLPLAAHPFYNRGVSYGIKGEYDLAIADFSEAIRLDPTNANTFYNRGF